MKWENPYKHIVNKQRVSVDVPREDVELIYAVLPEHGALVKIVTLAIKMVVDLIKDNGYTLEERQRLVAEIVRRYDGRGVKEVRRRTTNGKKVKHKSIRQKDGRQETTQ